jgi:cysteinyl-tRNA synthetase
MPKTLPPIHLYNTLTRRVDLFKPRKPGRVALFVCGPTVYDYAHIGHARTYIFFDFFARYLRARGYAVTYLQNITDVDDKIIRRAAEERQDPLKFSRTFTKEYLADMRTLGVRSVNVYAPATKFIPQIVKQVQTLIRKGYVYTIEGDGWYFDISKFKGYGKLSGRTALQAEDSVSRIDESLKKRNKGDFCLWKLHRSGSTQIVSRLTQTEKRKGFAVIDGEPAWNTPLGWGRPGWHIEDTAISEHYFGPQYDIHGGGLDLKFPHHEAEITQQESASGKKPFVRVWMHTGILTIQEEKMSKSAGNFVSIRDFLKIHSPTLLRFIFLCHHYRAPLDYNKKLVEDSRRSLEGAAIFIEKLRFFLATKATKPAATRPLDLDGYAKQFFAALDRDLNTPAAFAALFGAVNDVNKRLGELDRRSLAGVKKFLEQSFGLFGIAFPKAEIPAPVRRLVKEREALRQRQQFMQSDRLRKRINDLGYVVEDTPRGPFVAPASPKLWALGIRV